MIYYRVLARSAIMKFKSQSGRNHIQAAVELRQHHFETWQITKFLLL